MIPEARTKDITAIRLDLITSPPSGCHSSQLITYSWIVNKFEYHGIIYSGALLPRLLHPCYLSG